MKRREFVRACAAGAAGVALPEASQAAELTARLYGRARLVDEKGKPIALDALQPNVGYVFDYPYAATPCFLIRLERVTAGGIELKTQSGGTYRWEGGVGAGKAVVAYSAICAHKMTYPTKQVSFIGYRAEPSAAAPTGKVIACCSERSIYDPASGARVISGPAPQPLATILLEVDAKSGAVWAVGTFGGEMFDEFFRKYDFSLRLERGPRAREAVSGDAVVKPLDRYSTQWARC